VAVLVDEAAPLPVRLWFPEGAAVRLPRVLAVAVFLWMDQRPDCQTVP